MKGQAKTSPCRKPEVPPEPGPADHTGIEPGRRRTAGVEYVPIVLSTTIDPSGAFPEQGSSGRDDRATGPASSAFRFEPGDVLFGPGDLLEGAHRVVRGRVELVLEGRNCREMVLTSAGPGALVGEDYILGQVPSLVWAVAATEVETEVFDRDTLLQKMCADPDVARSLLLSLTKKLETTTIRLHNMTFMTLEYRVAKLLLAGLEQDDELGDVTHITHSEIARCTGSCRVAVSRTLKRMQKAGMVELRRGCIRLLNSTRLSRMACAAK